MWLEGCTALVTGASSGIGHALVRALAACGVRVRATGLELEGLEELAAACGADVLRADLASAEDVRRLVEWAGDADLLVNNAGYGAFEPYSGIEYEAAVAMLAVNLAAPMALAAALAPGMAGRGRGQIVNVASIAAYTGVPGEARYAGGKAGLVAFSDTLRAELAGSGVHVTVVVPAAVDTGFFAREGRAYRRRRPRLLSADEVAYAILGAVERDATEVFLPGWMRLPARLHGAAPGLFRRLAARQFAGHVRC